MTMLVRNCRGRIAIVKRPTSFVQTGSGLWKYTEPAGLSEVVPLFQQHESKR